MPRLPPSLQTFLHQPLSTSLLLSLSLHLALLALVQPLSGGGAAETFVINARLQSLSAPTPPVPEVPEDPGAEPEQAPIPQPTIAQHQEAVPAPQPTLLTSHVPSPAPPLPVAPAPAPAPEAAQPATPATVPAIVPVADAPASQSAHAPSTVANNANASVGIGLDPTWYIARQVDIHARPMGSIVPEYPEQARRRSQEGTLKLMLKIDDLGRVHDAEVVEADPPGIFDEAALAAFGKARFQPAMKDGRPVRYQAYIRVVFKLRD